MFSLFRNRDICSETSAKQRFSVFAYFISHVARDENAWKHMLFASFCCFPISFYTQKLSLQWENYDFCVSRNVMLTDFSGLEQGNPCFSGFSYLVFDYISLNISETKGFWIFLFSLDAKCAWRPRKIILFLRFSYFVLFGIVRNHCEIKQFWCF